MSCTKKVALVHDPVDVFRDPTAAGFPFDATAEWESPHTLSKFIETWRALGFDVVSLTPGRDFFERWANEFRTFDLVHSVLEGWGNLGREAWIPGLCEFSGVPFVGSGSFAMCTAMKKSVLKAVCCASNIPTADWVAVKSVEELDAAPRAFFSRPHFIKPDGEGSGVGVDAAHSISSEFEKTRVVTAELLSRFRDGVLIETLLEGAEVTTGLLGDEFLPVAQIDVDTGVYGLSNKSKEHMGERVSFPKIDSAELERATRALSSVLSCSDFVRMDFKKQGNTFYFLEANPLAGLSYHYSVFPKMAEAAGYSYLQMFSKLADLALAKYDCSRSYGRKLQV